MRIFQSILMILFVAITVYFVRNDALNFFQKAYNTYFAGHTSSELLNSIGETLKLTHKENTPGPLVAPVNFGPTAPLTAEGIISYTNQARKENGLPPLAVSSKLSSSSSIKVADMFKKQYFEHTSPSGISVGDLGAQVGYGYIVIGENLAMGLFDGDQGVVDAWMNSPGHRANILNDSYTDIGVSVEYGTYNGEKTWMAVQHFGRPLSLCPYVNPETKAEVDSNKAKIAVYKQELDETQATINNTSPSASNYRTLVDAYNSVAGQYNQLSADTKALVDQYNAEVASFNLCLQNSGVGGE